ncbi:MAG: type II secretion system protein [Planctomycetota bacterium]|jgi:prepilin-type N-terminal cleavage/methylation domain-containing protein/prepilin-type processing-associated H-X9-DG protein
MVDCPTSRGRAFTLIELLVVIAIIGLLISILVPALSRARAQGKSTVCLSRLRTVGQGMIIYANNNRDTLVPGRLPKIDDEHWRVKVAGGVKYRPTFLVMMGREIGIQPFDDPQPTKTSVDRFGEPGDRQDFSNDAYLCPEVLDWTDERNGCYGYNYQFLGNSRLRDSGRINDYKNWPIKSSWVRTPANCVAVADSMGTAASFNRRSRRDYQQNRSGESGSGRDADAMGNEGFNLDPPYVDPVDGEMANLNGGSDNSRTALHERHAGKGVVLWVDGHGSRETKASLGYDVDDVTGIVSFDGNNRYFNLRGQDKPWLITDPRR